MSGGTFQYKQYQIDEIVDVIERYINNNDRADLNEWGDPIGRGYEAETIGEFCEAVKLLKKAKVYVHRIDWLLAGDDGEDSFHRRLRDDLNKLG